MIMKLKKSQFRITLAAITATGVFLGAPWSIGSAQTTPTPNDGATRPPATSVAQAPALPYGVGEVVKMYQGGINKDVIVNYIGNTALPYHLNADGIIYMQTLGMPQEITKAMIQRDGQLQQQQQQANQQYYQQQPMPGAMPAPYGAVAAQPPMQVVTPTTPAPAVTVIGSDYPVYDYGYPYYTYGGPCYYWPPVIIGGWGWGWGWGHGGFRGAFGGFHGGGGFGGFHGGGGFGGFHGGGHGGGHR
jgi:hypothetical protein